MAGELDISRLVQVSVNLIGSGVTRRDFSGVLIMGDSPVIGAGEGIRAYSTLETVAQDFGVSAPEYKAALLYFAQGGRNLYIGRWLKSAYGGQLVGGAPASLAVLQQITSGSFLISIDGSQHTISDLDFSDETNLNGIASVINEALSLDAAGATCIYDGAQFVISSASVGAISSVGYASSVSQSVAEGLALTFDSGARSTQGGAPVDAATAVINAMAQSSDWYALAFAASTPLTDDETISVAAAIEAAGFSRIFGVTAQSPNVLDQTVLNDIASKLMIGTYERTLCIYSTASPYAAVSILANNVKTNWAAQNSTQTAKFKKYAGLAPERLTETQANALDKKRCNVYVMYNGSIGAISQEGVMSSRWYIDERTGADWLADALQKELAGLLLSAKKIPQTDAGTNILLNGANKVCAEAVRNGFLAPGVWNAEGFGSLTWGQYLDRGYYCWATPIAQQSIADREARKAPPIQVAGKLAGAYHSATIIIDLNR